LFLIHFTIHESLICLQFFVHLSVPKTQRAFKNINLYIIIVLTISDQIFQPRASCATGIYPSSQPAKFSVKIGLNFAGFL